MLLDILGTYHTNRTLGDPLPAGSAPFTSAAAFKTKRSMSRAKARSWDHKLSIEGAGRTSSTLKGASRVNDPSKIISLGTARPAPQYYPWEHIAIEADSVDDVSNCANTTVIKMTCQKGESAYDLGLALNYGYAAGSPQLLRFITEHIEMIHDPPYNDWECALTCGTTSAIEIVLRLLCNRGDSILSEAFTYPGTIEAAKALGVRMVGIDMDEVGLAPNQLESVLSNWDSKNGPKPSLLYTIPSGQNPTGATQTESRRKAIYHIAEQHDLLILEDDPYYFIQLGASAMSEMASSVNIYHPSAPTCPRERYLSSLAPSYLNIDTAGRVIRLDATSKILAPGLRCGWITACRQLIEKFINHTEMSTVAPSGLSQVFLYKLLDETWGHGGFIDWVVHLSSQYHRRLETLISACHKYLPGAVCEWTVPSSGMFLWIKVNWERHLATGASRKISEAGDLSGRNDLVLTIEDKLYHTAREHGVLVSKGSWFATDKASIHGVFFRMTFAAANDDALAQAVERFGKAISEEFAGS